MLKTLVLLALPIMLSQLIQMAYNLVDMFWLSKVGNDAVAASGTAGMFMWLSSGVLMISRIGAEIGVSQSLGSKKPDEAKKYAENAVWLAAVTGVFFMLLLLVFRHQLIGFFNIVDPAVRDDSVLYLTVVAIGIPFTYITSVIAGCFNAAGNSRSTLFMTSIGLVVNIILDPIMIFALDMGVMGAAAATAIAQILTAVISVIFMLKSKWRPIDKFKFILKPDTKYLKLISRWGVPVAVENILFCSFAMFTTRFEARFGTLAMAVSRIGSQIESITWMLGGSFGTALLSFIGQNYGAELWARIKSGVNAGLKFMVAYGAAITVILFFGAQLLFSVFASDTETIDLGVKYLRILSSCQIFMCIEAVASNAFKGTGRTKPPSIISICCNILRVVLAYLLSKTAMGLLGIWAAISIGAILRGSIMLVWYLISEKKRTPAKI